METTFKTNHLLLLYFFHCTLPMFTIRFMIVLIILRLQHLNYKNKYFKINCNDTNNWNQLHETSVGLQNKENVIGLHKKKLFEEVFFLFVVHRPKKMKTNFCHKKKFVIKMREKCIGREHNIWNIAIDCNNLIVMLI